MPKPANVIRESKDSKRLGMILRTLVGQPFVKAELSYLGELTVHLGQLVPSSHQRLADASRGSFVLCTRGSRWTVSLSEPPCLVGSDRAELDLSREVDKASGLLTGVAVCDVSLGQSPVGRQFGPGHSLILRFGNGAQISITPTEDPDNTHLSDWELFTPDRMYLSCGPGAVWSYLPSDTNQQGRESA